MAQYFYIVLIVHKYQKSKNSEKARSPGDEVEGLPPYQIWRFWHKPFWSYVGMGEGGGGEGALYRSIAPSIREPRKGL